MHNTHIYIYIMIIKNIGYVSGLVLGRRRVSGVSRRWLRKLLLYEYLLLVLFNHLLILLLPDDHYLHQLVLYMHVMMKQHLAFRQQHS
jgi:hypothetical protein